MNDSVMASSTTPAPAAIMVIIVLYRQSPSRSASYQSLIAAARTVAPQECRLHILLWDNTPEEQHPEGVAEGTIYLTDSRNLGLANAYNRALELAINYHCEWLITLDQDTELPVDYLASLVHAISLNPQDSSIGAIVPQIVAGGRIVSPNYFWLGAWPRWYPCGQIGVRVEPVFAFNSGSMIRVEALKQIGGYEPLFWLDNSDASMFQRLQSYGKRVYIAGDIQVDHDFSMKDMNQRMTATRYRNALLAESAFWDREMNWLAGCERTLRLALRQIKHLIRKDRSELQRITREFLWMRLFRSRQYRIQRWRTAAESHLGEALNATAFSKSPTSISVCMAAYNGGKFVEAQLNSILTQLRSEDELVIVDDCSTDDTVARIMAIQDKRIRLIRHAVNSGVVATFEHALRVATGDILFLCDDDDIWAPNKVERFLAAFETKPEAQIVTSRVQLMDDEGRPFVDGQLTREGKFHSGFWKNIYKNHYQGSAMAIRASLLSRVLPFPVKPGFMHDAWIGTRSDLTGGTTIFLEEDLLFYRRHARNLSRHLPLWKQLRVRAELLMAHAFYALRAR